MRLLMKVKYFRTEVVNEIPDVIEEGKIYISFLYNVSLHNCPCGCGHKVVIPINPKGWSVQYNGEDISFSPSIGNWSFECRSHYYIVNNNVRWINIHDRQKNEGLKNQKKKSLIGKLLKKRGNQ